MVCWIIDRKRVRFVLSRVQLFATSWTVPCQSPLSMGFSRHGYWSGLLLPSHGIFPTQPLHPHLPCLLHCKQILYPLSHQGSLCFIREATVPMGGDSRASRYSEHPGIVPRGFDRAEGHVEPFRYLGPSVPLF